MDGRTFVRKFARVKRWASPVYNVLEIRVYCHLVVEITSACAALMLSLF